MQSISLKQISIIIAFKRFKMKNSKYSNMGVSKYSAVYSEDCCEEHEGMPYTNFCTSITCVKPLCPECVQAHSHHHRTMRSQPEMHSLKNLKNQCISKVANILERIQSTEYEGSMNQINVIFENTLAKIREVRESSRRVIQSYFTSLEDHVRKKMMAIMSEQSNLFQEVDRGNHIINQLKLLVHRLDNSKQFVSSAQTIVRLDGEKIENKVKDSYSTIKNLKQHHKMSLYVQKNYDQKLINYLSKSVYYGNHQNFQIMPKMAQQLMTKKSSSSFNRVGSRQKLQSQKRMGYGPQRDDDMKSSYSRKSSRSIKPSKKQILGMNTFKQSSPYKYLHFFQKDENILQFLDLERAQVQFSEIELDITFKVPEFHKSISIPNGDLYLVGGSLAANGLKSQKIYKYDFSKNSLIYCNSLKYGRSSHSICFNNKYIYVLGGFINNQVITNRCQRYDIIENKVEEIRPMNYQSCSFACCSFNGRYIYKFGGYSADNQIMDVIEVYDEKEGEWRIVNPILETQGNLIPLASSAAVQITLNEIMVMGGYDQENIGQKQTYVLRVDPTGYYIRDINSYPLPYPQGFWNNTPIIQNKLVFALQNVSQGKDECLQNFRKILVFDGMGWKCLNN